MYEIYKIDENKYQLHSSYKDVTAVEGTLAAIYEYCISVLKFEKSELDYARQEMNWNEVDGAHFGMNRTFIYAFKRNKKVA